MALGEGHAGSGRGRGSRVKLPKPLRTRRWHTCGLMAVAHRKSGKFFTTKIKMALLLHQHPAEAESIHALIRLRHR